MLHSMKVIDMIKSHRRTILIFLVTELMLFGALFYHKQLRTSEYLDDITQRTISEYNVILDAFDEKATIAFKTMIDTPSVRTLFQKALQAPLPEQQVLREKLYKLLYPKYQALKKFGFKQLHFHTPDNKSFLRLHAPHQYGDDLSTFRHTVAYVNQTHAKISGFEEGIANNGYRFVFPLYGNSGYIGSVELSFSAYALVEFMKHEFMNTHFIIAKKALLNNTQNYIPSKIDQTFVTDRKYRNEDRILQPEKPLHLTTRQKPFSIPRGDKILTFIPVKNPVTDKISAFMIIASNGKYLSNIQNTFWIIFTGLSIIISMLFLYHIWHRRFQKSLDEEHQKLEKTNKKLNTILDTQESLIIITDGDTMVEVNARVLEFFGYDSFSRLTARHACICDFFIRHNDYFHLGRVPEHTHWIEYLKSLPNDRRIVTMVGIEMEPKAFQINITEYESNGSSIITLTDITEIVIRQKILQYKAQHDRLTDIYNRQKIDEVLEKICGYSSRRKEEVGVILFDIDHFKSINDTYGHHIGDEVLKAIARLVKNSIREDDIFGRWGGEEFILILKHTSLRHTIKKAQMLKEAIASMSLPDIPKVTASFGVAEVIPNDTTENLLKRVDIALYKAKNEGRNRVIASSVTRSQLVLSE